MPLLKREPEIFPANLFGEPPADRVELRGTGPDPRIPANDRVRQSELRDAGDAVTRSHAPGFPVSALTTRPWWIAYVRSRQEKALARHLLQWQVPYYLPQREHRFRAGDRIRTSHLPLFTGYVFCRGDANERLAARKSNLIVSLIDVPDGAELEQQLRSLWLLQLNGAPLVPHPYIAPGDEVEVVEGSLKGYRGHVLREKGRYRLVVSVHLLRQSVAAEVDREVVAPVGMRKVG